MIPRRAYFWIVRFDQPVNRATSLVDTDLDSFKIGISVSELIFIRNALFAHDDESTENLRKWGTAHGPWSEPLKT
jgi:hypothetical protein